MRLFLLFLATALSLAAADLTGKWTGTVEIPAGVFPVVLTLEQKGDVVSGSIATSDNAYPVQKGKISGSSVFFEVPADQLYVVDCVHENDRLTGNVKPAGGGAGKINVARAK